jgi:cbb3-type cytochrome oxidase subunit 1
MNWIVTNIKWIMVISGVLTSTMVYAAIDPDAALQSNFGETLDGPLARMIVRNWGALIAMVGAMLIYGAFKPVAVDSVMVLLFLAYALVYTSRPVN